MKFEIISQIEEIEVIAIGTTIRNLAYLEQSYGSGRWRKLKGKPQVKLPNGGNIRWVELHCMKLTASAAGILKLKIT